MKTEYKGEDFKIFMDGYKEGCKDTTTELCSCNLTEEDWDSLGEPMTQEELDELTEVITAIEEDNTYLDELSFIQGKKIGFDTGYEVGYAEATDDIEKYNVVLDGEFLDQVQGFKEQILSYRKEYEGGKNKDHNFMLYDLHHSLICLTEAWVMDQVWKYWDRNKGEENE